jgi:predicted Zn-dependent protease
VIAVRLLLLGGALLALLGQAGCATPEPGDEGTAPLALIKETVSPLNEYYLGRAVAAAVLARYQPYENRALATYLTLVGQALVFSSPRPELYGGYHFSVLDADEITAFSTPGGFVMVSRGLLRCCTSEDEVAAVLAHEIAHVQLYHGLLALKKNRLTRSFNRTRMTNTMTTMTPTVVPALRAPQAMQMAATLESAIFDISSTMIVNGYSRKAEAEADALAVEIMRRAGYDPAALLRVLAAIKSRSAGDARGFAKTHPPPEARVADLAGMIAAAGGSAPPRARRERFAAAMAGI